MVDGAFPGCDYTRDMELTLELAMGDVVCVGAGAIRGFAVWHSVPLVDGRASDELRILKLHAVDRDAFEQLVDALEVCASDAGLTRVGIRVQTAYADSYAVLVRRGYRVRWTDLRMTLDGFGEPAPPAGHTLFSNWEI